MAKEGQSLVDGLDAHYKAQQIDLIGGELSLVRNKRMKSVAMAVDPSQIPEAVEDSRKRGVPTDFTTDGRPIFESLRHQRKYLRSYGKFNRDDNVSPRFNKGPVAPPSRLRELAKRLAHRIRTRNYSTVG
jgi:hypothetical protein